MKLRLIVFPLLLLGCAASQPRLAGAAHDELDRVEVYSVVDFYEPLAEYGYWVHIPPHGWCWYPANVSRYWQPYGAGHWLWTEGDWYWESAEPWAWACYHYGRWFWHPAYGWTWVPGTDWAPAQVCWREGGEYVGWAPLPPRYDPQPVTAFVFIERRRFCEPITPIVVVHHHHHDYHTFVHQTVQVTKIKHVDQVIVQQPPRTVKVKRKERHEITPAPVHEDRRQPAHRDHRETRREQPVRVAPQNVVREERNHPQRGPVVIPQAQPVPREDKPRIDRRSNERVVREEAAPQRAEKPLRVQAVRPEATRAQGVRPEKTRSATWERIEALRQKSARHVDD